MLRGDSVGGNIKDLRGKRGITSNEYHPKHKITYNQIRQQSSKQKMQHRKVNYQHKRYKNLRFTGWNK